MKSSDPIVPGAWRIDYGMGTLLVRTFETRSAALAWARTHLKPVSTIRMARARQSDFLCGYAINDVIGTCI